jgi:TonB-dependent starch-binding outer membrane protein SusC
MKKRLFLLKLFYTCFFTLMSIIAFAQGKVSGKIVDDTNSGIPGVTVAVKGTSQGAVTDIDGNYSLDVPANATIVISSVGFATQEIAVGGQNSINVTLSVDTKTLSEVVVTGYGTQTKRDITGAVATVNMKEVLAVPSTNIAQAVQGRIAGVNVSNENAPGGGVMVRIRGFGTINDNSPLFVVDGTPTKGNLNTLNLNDIESMQVLKDASAASIYGSRAGNGVVIITTKRGKSGKPKFTYDAYYGNQTPIKFLDLLNTQQYATQFISSRINGNNNNLLVDGKIPDPTKAVVPNIVFFGGQVTTPVIPSIYRSDGVVTGLDTSTYSVSPKRFFNKTNTEGTNWLDEIFDSAPIQNHQIGVSGATDQAQYAMSVNYFDQTGIMKYTNYKRYSLRANTEFKVTKRVRIGETFQAAYGEQIGQPNGNQNESNPISFAYRMPPVVPVYDIRGYFASTPTNLDNSRNPMAELWRNKDNKGKEMRLFGNAYMEVDILDGLTARTQFGIDYNQFNIRRYRANDPESAEPVGINTLAVQNSYETNWTWYNTLTYNKVLAEKHKITAMVGTEAIRNYFEFFTADRSGFAVDDLPNRYLNAGRSGIANTGGASEWRLASEFARLNYSFSDKYLVDGIIRRDRSSRFASQFRSAIFPSVSAGWVISNEEFLKNNKVLSFAKLRVGYGFTGNQEIGNYNSYSTYLSSPESSAYDLNGSRSSSQPGYELAQFGNKNAKWESSNSTNVGLDAQFLDGKIEMNFDWYNRLTSDMLFPVEVQFTQGQAANPFQNIGEMRNRGVELALNYRDRKGDFTYSFGFNVGTYRNVVLKTTGDPATQFFGFSNLRLPTGTVSVTQQGYPLSSFFGYKIDGILQSDKEGSEHATQFGGGIMNKAGAFKFRDVNGDKVINGSDRTIIGSPHPDFTYGLNLSLGYKAVRLDVFGQGVQGNELFNYVRYWTDFPTFGGNRSLRYFQDSWEPGKTSAKLPIWRSNDVANSNPSSYYLEDGSYFRLKNVQLTFMLPSALTSKVGLGAASFYVQIQNALTFTKYEGLDPEVNLRNFGAGSDRQIGVDEGVYPAFRSTNIGVSVQF